MSRTIIQETQSGELAERLRARIQSDRLADGAFFMTEADLVKEYDVSRTVAREAVARLVALGLLEGRKRKGLVVRHPDPLHLLELGLPSLQGSQQDVEELAKLRYVIEMGAIELAVQNATAAQLDQLSQLANEIEQAIHQSQEQQAYDLDIAFHTTLLQMTGSQLVAGMQRVLVSFFATRNSQAARQKKVAERVVWEHQELAIAIRDRDSNRARMLLKMQSREWVI